MEKEARVLKTGVPKDKRRREKQVSLREKRAKKLRGRRVATADPEKTLKQLVAELDYNGQNYLQQLSTILHYNDGQDAFVYYDHLFGNEDIVKRIISELQNPSNAEAASDCLAAISTYDIDDTWTERLVQCDIAHPIMLHLSNKTNPNVCKNLMRIVANCCLDSIKSRDLFLQQGLGDIMLQYLEPNSVMMEIITFTIYIIVEKALFPPQHVLQPLFAKCMNLLSVIPIDTQDDDQLLTLSYSIKIVARLLAHKSYQSVIMQNAPFYEYLFSSIQNPELNTEIILSIVQVFFSTTIIDPDKMVQMNIIPCAMHFIENHRDLNVLFNFGEILLELSNDQKYLHLFLNEQVLRVMKMRLSMTQTYKLVSQSTHVFCKLIEHAQTTNEVNFLLDQNILQYCCKQVDSLDQTLMCHVLNAIECVIEYEKAVDIVDACGGLDIIEEMAVQEKYGFVAPKLEKILVACERKMEQDDMYNSSSSAGSGFYFTF